VHRIIAAGAAVCLVGATYIGTYLLGEAHGYQEACDAHGITNRWG
jgi:hypothetical protein